MASQIVAHHSETQGSALSPLFPPLANLPGAPSDAARAAQLSLGGLRVVGGGDEPETQVFDFKNSEGGWESFTADELRGCSWWYWLPAEQARRVEAFLFPVPNCKLRVRYVARSSKGGLLIRDSRLSCYFEGPEAREAAYKEQVRLRGEWPDAAVFEADSAEEAERLLAASSPSDEGLTIRLEQMAAARLARFASLLS